MVILSILVGYLLVVSVIVFFSNRDIEKKRVAALKVLSFRIDPNCKDINDIVHADYIICTEELSKRELMERYGSMS